LTRTERKISGAWRWVASPESNSYFGGRRALSVRSCRGARSWETPRVVGWLRSGVVPKADHHVNPKSCRRITSSHVAAELETSKTASGNGSLEGAFPRRAASREAPWRRNPIPENAPQSLVIQHAAFSDQAWQLLRGRTQHYGQRLTLPGAASFLRGRGTCEVGDGGGITTSVSSETASDYSNKQPSGDFCGEWVIALFGTLLASQRDICFLSVVPNCVANELRLII